MRVLILNNPVAGRGRSGEAADRVRSALVARGFRVDRCHTPAEAADSQWTQALEDTQAVVVVGGDGAVRRVAPGLAATRVPMFNVPCGTENLFARQFAMRPEPEAVADAVARMQVLDVDLGRFDGDAFFLMCGVGADASIVHRLARGRTGAITHASYVRHVLAELVSGRSPRVTIRADGRTLVDDRAGAAIFANSRQYALRIDPEPRASMIDGLLDLVFFPASTSAGALLWNAASLLRMANGRFGRRMGVVRAAAAAFEITVHSEGAQFQLDGDARVADVDITGRPLSLAAAPGQLRVLLP